MENPTNGLLADSYPQTDGQTPDRHQTDGLQINKRVDGRTWSRTGFVSSS